MEYKYKKEVQNTTWLNGPVITDPKYLGFVYEITNKDTGKKYIGCKTFWDKASYPPLQGLKNKRHFMRESKWRTYNGSGNFEEDVDKNPQRYKKVILKYCKSVTEMKATEAYIQLGYYISGEWYLLLNEVINLRLRIRK